MRALNCVPVTDGGRPESPRRKAEKDAGQDATESSSSGNGQDRRRRDVAGGGAANEMVVFLIPEVNKPNCSV